MHEALALAALAAALVAAVVRDRRAPEAAVALVCAGLLLLLGVLSPVHAGDEARALGPTLGLLAALLVLGDGCERAGLFGALAARIPGAARGSGRRVLHERDAAPALGEFLRLGALTVPPILTGATVALWLALQLL